MIGYYAVFLCSLIMAAESVTNAANVTATATHEIGSASIAPPSATNDSHHGIAKILVFMSTCSKRLFSSRVAVCILPCPPCFGMLGQAGCLRVHSPTNPTNPVKPLSSWIPRPETLMRKFRFTSLDVYLSACMLFLSNLLFFRLSCCCRVFGRPVR